MFTRRVLTSSSTVSPSTSGCSNPSPPILVLRTFTTSTVKRRFPSLADITPKNAGAFDAKQAKFREQVREAQKAKEKQDSQSVAATTPPPRSRGGPSSYPVSSAVAGRGVDRNGEGGDVVVAVGDASSRVLGSLSTHSPGAAREAQFVQESSKRRGKISSLIYGTHEGQQMDHDIERSFSQVLARGKYVHSIVFHTVKPDKVDEYVDLVGGWYPKVAAIPENHVHLVGSWRTEVGDCDTFGLSPSFHFTPEMFYIF